MRTRAAGRARVAKDAIDMGDINAQAAEQDALAEMALAEFASEQGIELESGSGESLADSESDSTKGTMGPESEKA